MTAIKTNDEGILVNWDRAKFRRFETAYLKARQQEVAGDTFTFEGHDFVLNYAKYLIEYLGKRLGK